MLRFASVLALAAVMAPFALAAPPRPSVGTATVDATIAKLVAAHGAAYVSMVGAGFSLFHSSTDRWPVAIDAEAIARNARLVLQFIRRFEPAAS